MAKASPTVDKEYATSLLQQHFEVAVPGRNLIPRFFGKSSVAQFYTKHGAELFALGILFYVNGGVPLRRRLCAFPSELRRWAAWKTSKGETI